MSIGWDTLVLKKNLSGVGNYIEKILFEINRKNIKSNILLFGSDNDFDYSNNYLGEKVIFANNIFSKSKLLRVLWEQFALPIKAKKNKIDILHCPAHVISLFFPGKIVLTIHDLSFKLFPKTFKISNRIYLNFIVPLSVKYADKIITVSKNTKEDLIREYNVNEDKIRVIYNGVDNKYTIINNRNKVENIKIKYELPEKFVLYLGTLEPRKNLKNLIKAYSKIKEKKTKLVIAGGKGWLYEDIFSLVNDKKMEDKVIFTGYVDEKDIVALYNAATLFVYPSLYEGFGLPPLEAMACGTPVITSNVSSLPEVVGDAAITVDPYNINGLAEEINKVLGNEVLQKAMIKKGIERAKEFTWEKTARETIRVYEEVLNQKLL